MPLCASPGVIEQKPDAAKIAVRLSQPPAHFDRPLRKGRCEHGTEAGHGVSRPGFFGQHEHACASDRPPADAPRKHWSQAPFAIHSGQEVLQIRQPRLDFDAQKRTASIVPGQHIDRSLFRPIR
jgi:hypothetical protein